MRDVLGHLPNPINGHGIVDHEFKDGARSYPGHTGSMYDLPSKAIKAGAHGVPGGENMIRFSDDSIRYLTVHEAKMLQGFHEDFAIYGAWGEAMRQIGNAVPSTLAEKIGSSLIQKCNDEKSNKEAASKSISTRKLCPTARSSVKLMRPTATAPRDDQCTKDG